MASTTIWHSPTELVHECLQMFNRSHTLVSISTQPISAAYGNINRREMNMPEINANINKAAKDLASVAKDATYVVVGAGVIGFQKAQVQRQDLLKRLGDPKVEIGSRIQGVRSDLSGAIHTVDAQLEDLISKVEAAFAPFEDRLPTPARDLAKQVHVQAKETRTQILDRILTVAG